MAARQQKPKRGESLTALARGLDTKKRQPAQVAGVPASLKRDVAAAKPAGPSAADKVASRLGALTRETSTSRSADRSSAVSRAPSPAPQRPSVAVAPTGVPSVTREKVQQSLGSRGASATTAPPARDAKRGTPQVAAAPARSPSSDDARRGSHEVPAASARTQTSDDVKRGASGVVSASARTQTSDDVKRGASGVVSASARSLAADHAKRGSREVSAASARSQTTDDSRRGAREAALPSPRSQTSDDAKRGSREVSAASARSQTTDDSRRGAREAALPSARSQTSDDSRRGAREPALPSPRSQHSDAAKRPPAPATSVAARGVESARAKTDPSTAAPLSRGRESLTRTDVREAVSRAAPERRVDAHPGGVSAERVHTVPAPNPESRRRYPRVPVDVPVRLSLADAPDRRFEARLPAANISVGGLFLSSSFFLKPGTRLLVELALPPHGRAVRAYAEVARLEAKDDKSSGFALRFTEYLDGSEIALATHFLAPVLADFLTRHWARIGVTPKPEQLAQTVDVLAAWELEKASLGDVWSAATSGHSASGA